MCVWTKPGITAQPSASITVSAVRPLPPIAAMRSPSMSRSPRTMVFAESIVTSVPFLMRIDDIEDSLRHKKAQEAQMISICAFCAFLWLFRLLRCGLRSLGLFTNRQPQLHLYVPLDLTQDLRVFSQRRLCIFPALAQSFAFVRKPRATLFHRALHHREIQQVTFARNAFAIHDVKFTFAERRRDFVLRHLHFRAIANHAIAVFDRADAPDIESQRRVKLERTPASRRFRIAEHDANLFADLVDEDEARV